MDKKELISHPSPASPASLLCASRALCADETSYNGLVLQNDGIHQRRAALRGGCRDAGDAGKVCKHPLKLYSYSVEVDHPRWPRREGFILQTEIGWGEIAPLPGFSRETLAEAREEIFRLWPNLSRAELPSVRFGFACAQKPLSSVHRPLAALHNPRPGFHTLKLKLGHLSPDDAIALVKPYIGHYQLRLDFNRAWTLEQALEFVRPFQPSDFVYLEEPLASFEKLVHFSELTHFPLAVDESLHAEWQRLPSLKALVIKPTVIGSIPAVPPHLDLILSSSYETGLGLLHIALLAANSLPLGLDTYRFLKNDLLTSPIQCTDGTFSWTYTHPPIDMAKLCPIVL